MNEKKPTWNCPVCHRTAYFTELVVDEYFAEICKVSKANEVDFEPSGTWKEHREKKEKKPKQDFGAESAPAAKLETIALDSDDENPTHETLSSEISEMKTEAGQLTFAPPAPASPQDSSVICISDSDDEPVSPIAKRSRMESREATTSPAVNQNATTQRNASQTPSTSSRPPSNIRSQSDQFQKTNAHIPRTEEEPLNPFSNHFQANNIDPNILLQLLASQNHLTQNQANLPIQFSHTQDVITID